MRTFTSFLAVLLVLNLALAVVAAQVTPPQPEPTANGDCCEPIDGCLLGDNCACRAINDCCDCGPLWVVTADALFLHRSRSSPYGALFDAGTNAQLLNAHDLGFATQAGPRIGLQRQLADGRILDIGYFGIEGWNSRADFGPGNYNVTGDQSQTGPPAYTANFEYASSLHTVDVNVMGPRGGWLQPLAGFRYVRLAERYQVTGVGPFGSSPTPYSLTYNTSNDLFGGQIGGVAQLWNTGRFSITCIGKSGLFLNGAHNQGSFYTPSSQPLNFTGSGTSDTAAFFSEVGLQGVLRLTDHWSLRGGYQMYWLNGVALAPNQVLSTDVRNGSGGISPHGAVFYEGANVGLQLNY